MRFRDPPLSRSLLSPTSLVFFFKCQVCSIRTINGQKWNVNHNDFTRDPFKIKLFYLQRRLVVFHGVVSGGHLYFLPVQMEAEQRFPRTAVVRRIYGL